MSKTKRQLRGKALLRAAWNFIAAHPEQWIQGIPFAITPTSCGCLGAHAARLANLEKTKGAMGGLEACGIPYKSTDGMYIYAVDRSLHQLRKRVVKICGPRGVLPVPKSGA